MEPANLLKIESLRESWTDKDHVMLHACFQLLSDFVEKEMSQFPYIDWNVSANPMNAVEKKLQFKPDSTTENVSADTRNIKAEIEELYAWWQKRKDNKIMNRSSSFNEDHLIYKEDNEMLKRLIDLRQYLWT